MLRRLTDVELAPSPGFVDWLASVGTLAIVRAGRLAFVGLDPDGELVLDQCHQQRPTAVAASDRGLWLAADRFLWRLEDGLDPGQRTHDGYERVLLPQVGLATGDLAVTDLALDDEGRPLVTSSRVSAVLRPDGSGSLEVVWRPPWISAVRPEDRCLLSGLAVEGGRPRWATAASTSDEPQGWRTHRRDGGVVVDVPSGELVATGLSLPHAPVVHDGRVWVVQTGTGEVGAVDLDRGGFEAALALPAFLRAAAVVDDHLVVGASARRDDSQWADLVLGERLRASGRQRPVMGLFVVDLRTGELAHQLVLDGSPRELFDVVALPGVRRARAVDPFGDDAQELVVYDLP